MSDNDDTGSVGLTRIGYVLARPLTEQQIQQGIARTMKDVVHDRYQPAIRPQGQTVRVVGAAEARAPFEPERSGNRSGWVEARAIGPVSSPFEERVINNLIDAHLGPVFPNQAKAQAKAQAPKPELSRGVSETPQDVPKPEPLQRRRLEE
jgi:hypothetical protein